MQIQNDSRAYGFLAGAAILILALLVNACAHYPAARDSRSMKQRAATAVEIFTECGSGSGVLLDGRTVLTAYHVVECDEGQTATMIAVRTPDQKSSVAIVNIGDPDRDLAQLKLSTEMQNVPPVHVREAVVGETVCASFSVPERGVWCGTVQKPDESPRDHGDVVVRGASIWYGNSGSGVYGADGALVGLTVRLNWCNIADAFIVVLTGERVTTCGGRVSSVFDSPVFA